MAKSIFLVGTPILLTVWMGLCGPGARAGQQSGNAGTEVFRVSRRHRTSLSAHFYLARKLLDKRFRRATWRVFDDDRFDRDAVKAYYDATAADHHLLYTWQLELAEATIPRALNAALLPSGPIDVLELGPGPGRTSTRVLADVLTTGRPASRHHILGVDLSPKNVELARKETYPGVDAEFRQCDAIDFLRKPAPGSWPLIVALGFVPYHLSDTDLKRFYDGLQRNLAPGGVALHERWRWCREDSPENRALELASESGLRAEPFPATLAFSGVLLHKELDPR